MDVIGRLRLEQAVEGSESRRFRRRRSTTLGMEEVELRQEQQSSCRRILKPCHTYSFKILH